ncbi:MAG TPA: ATP-binding protein [Candidatus Dormibacteraeota bacterium]|nr:ATP-binding protein [Candidatus Dormibacteraeota bacterium]
MASPVQALAELIWNAVDAEATKVSVEMDTSTLGLRSIRVRDNGHGIPPQEAEQLFMHLGGSWKRHSNKSKNGKRVLHGEEGKGRFRALALGRVAEWVVTVPNGAKQLVRYRITVIKDSARKFKVSPAVTVDEVAKVGVEVTISEPYKQWILDTPNILQELNEIYAIYLMEYPGVKISLLGTKLDPTKHIKFRHTFALPPIPDAHVPPHPVELEVVEWKTETERMLYLCSEDKFPLHRIAPGIHAPGFNFSAYLRSTYISQLSEQGTLELGTLDARLNDAVETAKGRLREHFKARTKEELKNLVQEWKSEQVYPYKDEPVTPVQQVERKVFDLVAVNVATNLPDFQTQDHRNKRFQLRILRQAIERSPEELQLILEEVLVLPQQKQEELAKLLKQTTLSSIISASNMVADRLNFINGLEAMLFDKELKQTFKERSQLHRILADNTWVFGEEFALTVDDQSLTEVLRAHFKAAKRKIVVNEPVKRIDGRTGIVDLMLSRRVPTNREEELAHLVVELKAPTVIAGSKETGQIRDYAFAVQADERFRCVPTRWSFWLVINDMDDFVKKETRIREKPEGLLWESDDLNLPSKIWVKTWAQILHDCKTS